MWAQSRICEWVGHKPIRDSRFLRLCEIVKVRDKGNHVQLGQIGNESGTYRCYAIATTASVGVTLAILTVIVSIAIGRVFDRMAVVTAADHDSFNGLLTGMIASMGVSWIRAATTDGEMHHRRHHCNHADECLHFIRLLYP
jgi:hypothetical protein